MCVLLEAFRFDTWSGSRLTPTLRRSFSLFHLALACLHALLLRRRLARRLAPPSPAAHVGLLLYDEVRLPGVLAVPGLRPPPVAASTPPGLAAEGDDTAGLLMAK